MLIIAGLGILGGKGVALPVPGLAAGLVIAENSVAYVAEVEAGGEEVSWISGSCPGGKRIRQNRKTHAHLAGVSGAQSRPHVWKMLRHVGHSVEALADEKRRRVDQQDEGFVPGHHRTGVGWLLVLHRPTSPGLHAEN